MRAVIAVALVVGLAAPAAAQEADPLDGALFTVNQGIGHLRQAAKSGEPVLLREAEREVVGGLLDGLDASGTDPARYGRVYDAYLRASGLFRDIPYVLEVAPGRGLPTWTLPLRRHPWGVISLRGQGGWRAEMVTSGMRLTPL